MKIHQNKFHQYFAFLTIIILVFISTPKSIVYAAEFADTIEAKSAILSRLAAPITGIAAKKENSAALFRGMPSILAPSIVAPERDVPGIMANA